MVRRKGYISWRMKDNGVHLPCPNMASATLRDIGAAIKLRLTLAQEISASKWPSVPSEVDFCTKSASVAESHSERQAASFSIRRAS
jgi:hypothetical protein